MVLFVSQHTEESCLKVMIDNKVSFFVNEKKDVATIPLSVIYVLNFRVCIS